MTKAKPKDKTFTKKVELSESMSLSPKMIEDNSCKLLVEIFKWEGFVNQRAGDWDSYDIQWKADPLHHLL